jgi:hypothetical protein
MRACYVLCVRRCRPAIVPQSCSRSDRKDDDWATARIVVVTARLDTADGWLSQKAHYDRRALLIGQVRTTHQPGQNAGEDFADKALAVSASAVG